MLFNQFPRRIVGTSLFESRPLSEAQEWIHCLISEKKKKLFLYSKEMPEGWGLSKAVIIDHYCRMRWVHAELWSVQQWSIALKMQGMGEEGEREGGAHNRQTWKYIDNIKKKVLEEEEARHINYTDILPLYL